MRAAIAAVAAVDEDVNDHHAVVVKCTNFDAASSAATLHEAGNRAIRFFEQLFSRRNLVPG